MLILPLVAWAYCLWISPRPYYVAEDDPEQTTYHDALLLRDGQAIPDLHTPGITTTAIAAAVFIAGFGEWPDPEKLFPVLRFVAAICTGIGLWFAV